MNKRIVFALLLIAGSANAQWKGKLDLASGPRPFAARELNDGMWLVGGKQPLANVSHNGIPIFTCGAFTLTRLELQNPAFGITAGLTDSGILHALFSGAKALGALSVDSPPFIGKLTDLGSIEGFVGYRPNGAYDQHHIVYGVSAEVNIKWSDLQLWAKGENGQKGL